MNLRFSCFTSPNFLVSWRLWPNTHPNQWLQRHQLLGLSSQTSWSALNTTFGTSHCIPGANQLRSTSHYTPYRTNYLLSSLYNWPKCP
jgi:hypothetical protein